MTTQKRLISPAIAVMMLAVALMLGGCGSFDKDKLDDLKRLKSSISALDESIKEQEELDLPSDMKKAITFGYKVGKAKSASTQAAAKAAEADAFIDGETAVGDDDNKKLAGIISTGRTYVVEGTRLIAHIKTDISKYEAIRADRKGAIKSLEEDAARVADDFRDRKEKVDAAVARYPDNSEYFAKAMSQLKVVYGGVEVAMRGLKRSSVSSIYLARKSVDEKTKDWGSLLAGIDKDLESMRHGKTVILKDMMTVKHPKILLVVYDDYDNIDKQIWVPVPEKDIDKWSAMINKYADGIDVFTWGQGEVKAFLKANCPNYSTWGYQYIEDIDWTETYYHKYIIVDENDKVTETDFKVVDEDTWEDNLENLGMEIYKKPVGLVTAEADDEAALPPGMDKVGDAKYGQWTGSGANRHWSWFDSYMFYATMNSMMGPRYIMYDDYSSWNRSDRPSRYYGGTMNKSTGKYTGQKWGTESKATKAAYTGKSKFSKSGGYKASAVSVRQAARAARGGGPGGGGK